MAARYVNPDNITAQGQYFYTGLPPGSYDTGGAGGGNVYGAGSGGSAGVAADRTGSDSQKTWAYKANIGLNFGRMTNAPGGRKKPPEGGIIDDPPESPPPIDPGKRRKPVSNGGPQEIELYKGPFIPGTTTPMQIGEGFGHLTGRASMAPVDPTGPFGKKPLLQLGPGTSNQGPPTSNQEPDPIDRSEKVEFPGGNAWENWEKRSDAAKTGAVGRKKPDRKMATKDAIWGMTQIANADGTQGMWGAFTSSSASRAHSRPRTF